MTTRPDEVTMITEDELAAMRNNWRMEEPTAHLKFVGGKLHQAWKITGPAYCRQEWREVPSEP